MGVELILLACLFILAGAVVGRVTQGGRPPALPSAATPELPAPAPPALRALGMPFDLGDVVSVAADDVWLDAATALFEGPALRLVVYRASTAPVGPGAAVDGEARAVLVARDAAMVPHRPGRELLRVQRVHRAVAAPTSSLELDGAVFRRLQRRPLEAREWRLLDPDQPAPTTYPARRPVVVAEYEGPGEEWVVVVVPQAPSGSESAPAGPGVAYRLLPIHPGQLERWGRSGT